jgi:predicted NBD/HSP70 family sugar kinase
VIGMDLGGTYLRAALADEYGRVVLKRRVETLAHEGPRGDLVPALALDLRPAELRLGSAVISNWARGRTIDDLGPVLVDEGARGPSLL